jgi:hypothetical protein
LDVPAEGNCSTVTSEQSAAPLPPFQSLTWMPFGMQKPVNVPPSPSVICAGWQVPSPAVTTWQALPKAVVAQGVWQIRVPIPGSTQTWGQLQSLPLVQGWKAARTLPGVHDPVVPAPPVELDPPEEPVEPAATEPLLEVDPEELALVVEAEPPLVPPGAAVDELRDDDDVDELPPEEVPLEDPPPPGPQAEANAPRASRAARGAGFMLPPEGGSWSGREEQTQGQPAPLGSSRDPELLHLRKPSKPQIFEVQPTAIERAQTLRELKPDGAKLD